MKNTNVLLSNSWVIAAAMTGLNDPVLSLRLLPLVGHLEQLRHFRR